MVYHLINLKYKMKPIPTSQTGFRVNYFINLEPRMVPIPRLIPGFSVNYFINLKPEWFTINIPLFYLFEAQNETFPYLF